MGALVTYAIEMTRAEQEDRETRHVLAMLAGLRLEVVDRGKKMAPPLPDFEVQFADGRRVGVEVTEAVDGDVAAAWGGARSRLEREIVRCLEREAPTMAATAYLHVDALLDLERDPRLLAATAAKIAAIARVKSPGGLAPTNGVKLGLPGLRHLELQRADRPWASISSSAMPLGWPAIQRAIDQKVGKLDEYRALGAHEYWLLVVGGRVLSGYVGMADAQARVFESSFDQTVFLDSSEGTCVILKTRQPRPVPVGDAAQADQ